VCVSEKKGHVADEHEHAARCAPASQLSAYVAEQ